MHKQQHLPVRDLAEISTGEMVRLVEEVSEKECEALHSMMGLEKVEEVGEGGIVETEVGARDKTDNLDH